MKKQKITLFILAFLTSLSPLRSSAQERGMSVFYGEYAMVQEYAFGGEGSFDDLMKLSSLSSQKADFIASFWRARALMEVGEEVTKVITRVSKRLDGTNGEAIQKEAQAEASYLFYSYYYDNWEAINKMIAASLEQTIRESKSEQGGDGDAE